MAPILVTPSTMCATSSPNFSRIFVGRRKGVFDDVVQQARGDAHRVELHFGQDVGHLERVDQVRLAGMADLSLVLQGREHVGPAEQFQVGVRAVAADLVEQVLEPDHVRCLILYRFDVRIPVSGV